MQVVDAATPGGPEMLVWAERPLPSVGDDDVLIEVAAAGVNRADILQRRGFYPSPAGAPSNPGLEVAGTVAALGRNVSEFKLGDAVCALLQGGGYSEYCSVHSGQVLPVPGKLTLTEAAALPEAYFTVWSNVFEFGRLQPGELLLVHGGSSGIGTTAIQLGKVLGSTVYTTAGTDDKCRFCEQLGAARAINYKTQDFVAVVAEVTGKAGVNVVLDMVGGSYLERNVKALATEGRLVIIATQAGREGQLDISRVMQQRLVITGSTLRARSVEFKRQIKAKLLRHVWPLLAQGSLRPIVDKVFSLHDAAQAHRYMESGAHQGKIVLTLARQGMH
jgi:NADPH2:quinone reductase